MAYNSTIKVKYCRCGCGRLPSVSYGGYFISCAPEEIFEEQKAKKVASRKKSDAKRREKGIVRKLATKTVFRKPGNKKPLPKVSKRRMAELKTYSVLRKDFLIENPTCRCTRNGCKRIANEVHHLKGRENGLLNVVEFWLPVNSICHRWITDHPKEAMELGLCVSRLNSNEPTRFSPISKEA